MRYPHSVHQFIRLFFIVNITTYTTYSSIMAPRKENTKKAAGNAKVWAHSSLIPILPWMLIGSLQKAEVAAQKQAEQNARLAQKEDEEWSKGAKSNAKKYGNQRYPRSFGFC